MSHAQQETTLSLPSVPSTLQSVSRNSVISSPELSISDDDDDEEIELSIVDKKTTPDIKNNVTNCSEVRIVHNNTSVYRAPVTVNQTVCHDPLKICKVSETTRSMFFVAVFVILIVGASIIVFVRVFTMPDSMPSLIVNASTTLPRIQTIPLEPPETAYKKHGLKLISHRDWEKQDDWNTDEVKKKFTVMPVPYVVITETRTAPCFTMRDCVIKIKLIQHMQSIKKLYDNDVPYNFLVGGDGSIYEGRGWDLVADNDMIHGNESIVIGLIGYFENRQMLKEDQSNAVQKLIELGIESRKIKADYELINQKPVFCSINPISNLCNITKT